MDMMTTITTSTKTSRKNEITQNEFSIATSKKCAGSKITRTEHSQEKGWLCLGLGPVGCVNLAKPMHLVKE
jgi:hypothetical protein